MTNRIENSGHSKIYQPRTEAPKVGERLVVPVSAQSIPTINWHTQSSLHPLAVADAIFRPLTVVDPVTNTLRGEIAESVISNADATRWTIQIKDIPWSDGTPTTAEDVLKNFEVAQEMLFMSSLSGSSGKWPECRVADPRTVECDYTAPMPDFPEALIPLYLMPKRIWEKYHHPETGYHGALNSDMPPADLIGHGPFRLTRWDSSQRIKLDRNPHYFKPGQPYLDEVVFVMTPDYNTSVLKLLGKEVDALWDISASFYAKLAEKEATGNYHFYLGPERLGSFFLLFNRNPRTSEKSGKPYVAPDLQPIFQDRRFAWAMSHAMDRLQIARTLFGSDRFGFPKSCLLPKFGIWTAPCADIPRDLKKANALLNEMGLKDIDGDGVRENLSGKPLQISIGYGSENQAAGSAMVLFQKDAADIGLKLNIHAEPFEGLFSKIQKPPFDWEGALLGFSANGLSPVSDRELWSALGPSHYWNPKGEPSTEWEKENEADLQVVLNSGDQGARVSAFHRMQKRLYDEQALITIANFYLGIAVHEDLREIVFSPLLGRFLNGVDGISWENADKIGETRNSDGTRKVRGASSGCFGGCVVADLFSFSAWSAAAFGVLTRR